ncbi:MAG: hypothetical protein II781_03015 [Clostridia bacterium]|nr:hypothetical protein [Clostridia bacterium]
MLSKLLHACISKSRSYQQLLTDLADGIAPVSLFGVPEGLKTFLCAALSQDSRPVILLMQNESTASRAYDDLCSLLGKEEVCLFPARSLSLYRNLAESRDLSCRRLEAMLNLRGGSVRIVVAPIEAVLSPLMPVSLFEETTFSLQKGEQVQMDDLIRRLLYAGYERTDTVSSKGEFAQRGGILDIYPANMVSPVRIEFFDDEIDTLRSFDPITQRSTGQLDTVTVCPAQEAVLTEETACHAARKLEKELRNVTVLPDKEDKVTEEKVLDEFFPLQAGEEKKLEELPSFDELSSLWNSGGEEEPAEEAPDLASLGEYAYLFSILEHLRKAEPFGAAENFITYLYEKPATLFDYLPDAVTVFDEPASLKERCSNILLQFSDQLTAAIEQKQAMPEQSELLCEYAAVMARCRRSAVSMQLLTVSTSAFQARALITFSSRSGTLFHGNLRFMEEELTSYKKQAYTILVLAGGMARASRLAQSLRDLDLEAIYTEGDKLDLTPGTIQVLPSSISSGFILPDEKVYILSDGAVYASSSKRMTRRRRKTVGEKIDAFTDLEVGDYVVHETHGIGIYQGIKRIETDGKFRDYLYIQYQGSDVLYVPTEQLDCVQRFIGTDGASPHLNKLGSSEWVRQKARVKASIKQLAFSLVQLYAERQTTKGFAFSKDSPWQREFEDSFPYEETDDQLQCIDEIKQDMERMSSWTASCAGMSATAKPRLPCVLPSRRLWTASRWPSWSRPPFWPSSTWGPFTAVSVISPYATKCCPASVPRRNRKKSSGIWRTAISTLSSAHTVCSARMSSSRTSGSSSSTRNSASASPIRKS